MNDLEVKPYYPSNGTEGLAFEEKYCYRCVNEKFVHTQEHGDKQCDIFNTAILSNSAPKEWQIINNIPTCIAHKHWDWYNNDGTLSEPKEPIIIDPNQISILDLTTKEQNERAD